jgi:hypothetical protein
MAFSGMSRQNPRDTEMTKLRNIVGIAFVAMSLMTGFAVTSAHAQIALQPGGGEHEMAACEYLPGYGEFCE